MKFYDYDAALERRIRFIKNHPPHVVKAFDKFIEIIQDSKVKETDENV